MNLLASNQDIGSIRVIKIAKKSNDMLHVDIKGELCHGSSRNNYISKILTFQYHNVSHLAILRKSGSIQLYTKNPSLSYYNLFKDWKNNLTDITGDGIIALDILDNQYLYSCSREGKLIIRDVINDDADEGYRVYMVGNNIGKVDLKLDRFKNTISVAICGKNCELKVYEIDLSLDVKDDYSEGHGSDLSYVGITRNRILQRSFTTLNLNPQRLSVSYRNHERRSSVSSLGHFWKSTTNLESYIYNVNDFECISQWMSAVQFIDGGDNIICGSQMGELILYDPLEDTLPIFTSRVSQFPIKTLKQMDEDHIIFSDSVSKIGIFQIRTKEIVLEYQGLEFGPFLDFQYILPNIPKRKISGSKLSFEEIYIMATTVDKRVMVYKLLDNGSHELLLDVKLFDGLIPSICLLNSVSEYYQFRTVFGELDHNTDPNIYKKRKVTPNLAIPISSSPCAQTRTAKKKDENGVEDKSVHIFAGMQECNDVSPISSSPDTADNKGQFIDDAHLQKMLVK
ncbi:conserved hypothetical protein [Candida tropicalis MYA-3404]|uniref:Ribosome biogenesis protein NSA1 n=1 Tax=Candida tropicalis (strain ATCC MYA-3404 / T1) TaxID=294747 RepID=C5MBF1_CANTT|nr:conserved hypothetical protein [Candida tropicalis MYA-3404]EER32968.1 conserved hypothetical protein [Candida tropicalis MYA-3404]KAG4406796.1 hypothetical protein JTP64_004180 [Candida tropicalis]